MSASHTGCAPLHPRRTFSASRATASSEADRCREPNPSPWAALVRQPDSVCFSYDDRFVTHVGYTEVARATVPSVVNASSCWRRVFNEMTHRGERVPKGGLACDRSGHSVLLNTTRRGGGEEPCSRRGQRCDLAPCALVSRPVRLPQFGTGQSGASTLTHRRNLAGCVHVRRRFVHGRVPCFASHKSPCHAALRRRLLL